eukprot:TRINITY_DN10151_c0_g1_i2.p1 TRINITY_DN10151_c0_g1~~TRINITY_DN10151_c0_g1_i2.p1  ORF type:complete len:725 (+),score=147.85 TRINITY_DN10151_c0_g1_i2:60-2234(+)
MAAEWNFKSSLLHDDTHDVTESQFLTGECHEATAMDVNRDGDRALVAGMAVFKLVSYKDKKLEERSLRTKKTRNLSFSDVVWHQTKGFEQWALSGTTKGIVSIWNLEANSREKVDHLESLNRNINKVEINKLEPNIFVAGSMGGLIAQWDLRTKQQTGKPINSKKAIRNLAFSPHDAMLLASANEEGVVMLYDRRMGTTPVGRHLAHDGPIYALAWHPRNRGQLATGGRDKTIRIFDASGSLKQTKSFHAVAVVQRLAWDPVNRKQLACCYLHEQSAIDIWNLDRPYFPFYRIADQPDPVADFVWSSVQPSKLMVSVTKKGQFCRHAVSRAEVPHQTIGIQRAGFAWSASPYCCFFRRADSSSPSRPNRSSKADTLDKPLAAQVQSQVIVSQTDSEDATGIPSACLQDNARHALIATLAEDYSLNYRQPRQACEHNANVASQHGLHDISQLWTMLRMVLLESLEQTEQAATLQTQTEEQDDEPEDDAIELKQDLVLEDVKPEPFESREGDDSDETGSGEDEDEMDAAHDFLSHSEMFTLPTSLIKRQQRIVNEMSLESVEGSALLDVSLLTDAILHYADNDNAQLASVLLIVFNNYISLKTISLDDQEAIFLDYDQQLDTLQLWTARGTFLRHCPIAEVRGLTEQGTTMIAACVQCQGPMLNGVCTSCKATVKCSVCRLQVTSLYIWCRGCGHGGHRDHLMAWFKRKPTCPVPGCGHVCKLPLQ